MNIKKRATLALFRRYRKTLTKLHELNYLFWECTLRCNFNCMHCGSDCMYDSIVPDMPREDFIAVLQRIKPFVDPHKTMIVLTGGEPLVRKDLEECGEAFYNLGFPWGFVTNGWGLNKERLISLLNAGLRSITVSLDGLSPETHDKFRGKKGAWNRAVNAIELVASTPDLVYDVVTCVNRENIDDLPKMRDLLLSLGAKYWRLFLVFPKGRAAEHPMLQLSTEEYIGMLEFIRTTRKEGQIDLSAGCEGFLGDYELEVRDTPFFCRAGINVASVLANGDISACPSLRGDYIQGNIYRDDFWDVWNNRYQVMRDRSWTKTDICASCKSYKFCLGNGLHLRDESTGKLLYCNLQKMGKL